MFKITTASEERICIQPYVLYVSVGSVQTQLSVGAVQNPDSQKQVVSKGNFRGCLENLLYNSLNLIQLVKHKDHQVKVKVSSLSRTRSNQCTQGHHVDPSSDLLW